MIPTVNLRDSYKEYKKTAESPIDSKPYLKITGGLFKFMSDLVLDGGHDVELGGGESLGTISIRGTKAGKLKTDWKHTYALWNKNPAAKEANERIYYLNDHSNGITYHFYWWTTGMKIGFKRVYSLKFAKDSKRKLTRLARDGKEWLVRIKRNYDDKQTNGVQD